MFPLWDVAIAPVLSAADVRRVVEIGAQRGDTTRRMLESLGPDVELHVIDPVPDFDPSEHERQFPGRYFLHAALSLDMLPTLGPVDGALIDGDHNWYTVYNELRLIARGIAPGGCAAAGARPARRRLALRAARPLLRARDDPRGVPPALRPGGDEAGHSQAGAQGWPQPHHEQRRDRGRAPQRRHDRARRLHRRARPPGAPGGPADLLRPGHRRRGRATRPPAGSRRGARPAGERRGTTRPAAGRRAGAPPGDALPAS